MAENENIFEIAERMRKGVEVKDRKRHLKTYKTCFVGRDAVKWMIKENIADSELKAVNICNQMVKEELLRHVTRANKMFENTKELYRWRDEIKQETVNTTNKEEEQESVPMLANPLRSQTLSKNENRLSVESVDSDVDLFRNANDKDNEDRVAEFILRLILDEGQNDAVKIKRQVAGAYGQVLEKNENIAKEIDNICDEVTSPIQSIIDKLTEQRYEIYDINEQLLESTVRLDFYTGLASMLITTVKEQFGVDVALPKASDERKVSDQGIPLTGTTGRRDSGVMRSRPSASRRAAALDTFAEEESEYSSDDDDSDEATAMPYTGTQYQTRPRRDSGIMSKPKSFSLAPTNKYRMTTFEEEEEEEEWNTGNTDPRGVLKRKRQYKTFEENKAQHWYGYVRQQFCFAKYFRALFHAS
eukprot:m.26961 g.26961  ORF g.26961 m.26961 type:complete len:415 (-) comp7849_c1_seq1:123-1367(-)